MTTSATYIIVSVVIYLVGMLVIGGVYSKNSNTEEFYLGGRKLGPIVTAMSTEASDMSAYLLMGVPGLALFCGLAEASWTAIGLSVGTYLNWLIVARRLRIYSSHIDAITVPEFLSKRFRDNTKVIETLGAIVIIVFFVPYVASGFSACGKLFKSLFGFDYMTTMIISAIVIVAYCAAGGFMAASVTSLIQGIVMTIALVIILFFGAKQAGGWNVVFENAKQIPGYLSLTASTDITKTAAGEFSFLDIVSTLAWGLGYFGMPHILLHFMAIEDVNKLKQSRRIGSIWCVISLAVAVVIGIIGYSLLKLGLLPAYETASAAESIMVDASNLLARFGVLPALVAGIIIAGILSATMSTADAQLLAAASGVTQNLITDVFGVKMSDKKSMLIARITVVGVAVLGAVFASNPDGSVFRIVSFAWAGFGATFGPAMLFGLFWKRCNKWGAIAGMLSGAAMVFIWKFAVRPLGGIFGIYELLPAFLFSCLVIVIVSLATKAPEDEITAEFDEVNEAVKAL